MQYIKYLVALAAVAGIGLGIVNKIYAVGWRGYAVLAAFVFPLVFGGIGAMVGKGLTRAAALLCLAGFAYAVVEMRDARSGEPVMILAAAGVGALASLILMIAPERTAPRQPS